MASTRSIRNLYALHVFYEGKRPKEVCEEFINEHFRCGEPLENPHPEDAGTSRTNP